MENEKNNLSSFEVKEEETKKMAPRAINNTPFHAVPDEKGNWRVIVGKFVIIDKTFASYNEAVKGLAKHKWEVIINLASLCASIQIDAHKEVESSKSEKTDE